LIPGFEQADDEMWRCGSKKGKRKEEGKKERNALF
jgi:hypothetical protein